VVGIFSGLTCYQNDKNRLNLLPHSAIAEGDNLSTGTGSGGREVAAACSAVISFSIAHATAGA